MYTCVYARKQQASRECNRHSFFFPPKQAAPPRSPVCSLPAWARTIGRGRETVCVCSCCPVQHTERGKDPFTLAAPVPCRLSAGGPWELRARSRAESILQPGTLALRYCLCRDTRAAWRLFLAAAAGGPKGGPEGTGAWERVRKKKRSLPGSELCRYFCCCRWACRRVSGPSPGVVHFFFSWWRFTPTGCVGGCLWRLCGRRPRAGGPVGGGWRPGWAGYSPRWARWCWRWR